MKSIICLLRQIPFLISVFQLCCIIDVYPEILPHYEIRMDSLSLENLLNHPAADTYFPAMLFACGESLSCQVKFRGSTSLYYPKKNWRIKFPDDKNVFKSNRLNLNAEYRDLSLMRNHLVMRLFRYYHQPAPNTTFIHLSVNNKFAGVYLRIQEIDPSYLNQRGITTGNLFKAISHGASFAPLAHISAYKNNWEIRAGHGNSYSDLQSLISRISYLSTADFEKTIEDLIEMESVIHYFAIVFSIVSPDCMTKNYFLYQNFGTGRYGLIPWDQDATLGNNIHGNYQTRYERYYRKHPLDNQMLFNRLMEIPHYRELFHETVERIIDEGFDFLTETIDSTYAHIREWVYLDSLKKSGNNAFDREIDRLKSFLEKRRGFLEDFAGFDRRPISQFFCSNPYPSRKDPNIVFRVYSSEPQDVHLMFTKNLNWDGYGQIFTLDSLRLFDDGLHDDLLAGDGIYGNSLFLDSETENLIPFFFRASKFDSPPNGLFYAMCERTHTMAINITGNKLPPSPESVRFGGTFKTGNHDHIRLTNRTDRCVDLSFCVFQSGHDWQRILIPENTTLESFQSLIMTSDTKTAKILFPSDKIIDGLFFDIGDTLALLSPAWAPLLREPVNYEPPLPLVINEMNVRSSTKYNSEDWIEIHNPNREDVSLKGWSIKDKRDDRCFIFLKDDTIRADGYFVCCRDTGLFHTVYEKSFETTGNMNFGLDRVQDAVRLYNSQGLLIDSVGYNTQAGWLSEPENRTLELIHPARDNARPENWVVSSVDLGTPGKRNSVWASVGKHPSCDSEERLFYVYPNPFNVMLHIHLNEPMEQQSRIHVFNLLGQKMITLPIHPGSRSAVWDASRVSSGIYILNLQIKERIVSSQKVLLVR